MNYLEERRSQTLEKIKNLRNHLNDAEDLLRGKACVYATGSFGRLESGANSDLDLFIVSKTGTVDGVTTSQLRNLDAILVKAHLINSIRTVGIPDFDSDGKYLGHYSVDEFTKHLGDREDDARNTLTGRLLLFLESRPLLGTAVYDDIIEDVIAAYWRDYEDHATTFMPAFLANDILRLWRTFCVNYEAGTLRDPLDKKIEGKIKNYKLKHSRMLTCYSALLFLLGVFKLEGSVSVERAKEMTRLTPTQRLDWLREQPAFETVRGNVDQLLNVYADFLKQTDRPKAELLDDFQANSSEWSLKSYEFGDLMFEVLQNIGKDNKFYRLLVV